MERSAAAAKSIIHNDPVVALPAKYAVKHYMKEQLSRIDSFSSEEYGALRDRWRDQYRGKRLSSCTLHAMAEEFRGFAEGVGGFSFRLEHVTGTKLSPNRETVKVTCYIALPVNLLQGWYGSDEEPYSEPVILLHHLQGEFGVRQTAISLSHSYVALTQHALERIYERTEVEYPRFRTLVHEGFTELLQNLAFAERAGLYALAEGEEGEGRYAAVCYAGGLLIVNSRVLIANGNEGELGFRTVLPKFHTTAPFLAPDHVVRLDPVAYQSAAAISHLTALRFHCSLTYMDIQALSGLRSDYYYAFADLMDRVSEQDRRELMDQVFAPRAPHLGKSEWTFDGALLPRIRRTGRLLTSGWMKMEADTPFCVVLPYGS